MGFPPSFGEGGNPTGPAGGALAGNYPNPTLTTSAITTPVIFSSTTPWTPDSNPQLAVRNDWTAEPAGGGNQNIIAAYATAKGSWSTAHVLYGTRSYIVDAAGVNQVTVTGCTNNGSGLIRVTTGSAHGYATGDRIIVDSVTGTTEANGSWIITVIDTTHFDLQGSTFTNAYVSGGIATNRAGYTGFLALVTPNVTRGGLAGANAHADDVNGYFISNNGTAKATDAFYVGASTITGGGDAWNTLLSSDAQHNAGIHYSVSTGYILQPTAYNTAASPFQARKARGTLVAPLRVDSGDVLLRLQAEGAYAADDVSAGTFSGIPSAYIDLIANENYTTTARGSRIGLFTATLGSTVAVERVRVAPGDGFDFNSGTFTAYCLRLKSNNWLTSMNNAGSATVNMARLNTSDQMELAGSVIFSGTGIGFYNKSPIAQPSAVGSATGYAAGSTAVTFHSDDTYTGNTGSTAYTINGIVAALKNLGLVAA